MDLLQAIIVLSIQFYYVHAGMPGEAQPMIIPALGRPFVLGALYNEPKSEVIIGLALWNMRNMSAKTFVKDLPNVNAKLISSHRNDDIRTNFDLTVEMSASMNDGMVTISGSANFFIHKATPSNIVAVTFAYESRTHMEELTMEALANLDYGRFIDKLPAIGATHVVTAIEYGANANFRLTKTVTADNFALGVHAQLKLDINAGFGTLSGKAKVGLDILDETNDTAIYCNYYGDVSLPISPMSYEDALEAYGNLSEMINRDTAVPMRVYLTPIAMLDNKANKLVRQITQYLLHQIDGRMQRYNDLEDTIADLTQDEVSRHIPTFGVNVESFKAGVGSHKLQLQLKLLKVLPLIKRGQRAEVQLAEALDESKEIFTMDNLDEYARWKITEAQALAESTQAEPEFLVYNPGDYERRSSNSSLGYIITFTLYLYDLTEMFSQCLQHTCGSNRKTDFCQKVDCVKYNSYVSWTQEAGMSKNLTRAFSKFKRVVEHNRNISAGTLTLIRESPKDPNRRGSFSIDLFDTNSASVLNDIELPEVENITRLGNDSYGFNITWGTSLDIYIQPSNFSMNVTNSTNVTTESPIYSATFDQNERHGNDMKGSDNDITTNLKFLVQFRYPEVGNWTNMTIIDREAYIETVCNVEVRVCLYCIFGICADATALYEGINEENITCSENRMKAFEKRQQEAIKHRKIDNEEALNKTRIVIIGGETDIHGKYASKNVIVYSPLNRTTQVPSVELGHSISQHTADTLASGRVLLTGGILHASLSKEEIENQQQNQAFKGSEIWDNITQKIEALLVNKNAAERSNPEEIKEQPLKAKAEIYGNKVMSNEEGINAVSMLVDIDLLTTHDLKRTGMKESRHLASTAILYDRVYICGGRDSARIIRNDCEVYTEGPWYMLGEKMQNPRAEFAMVSVDDEEMYAIGGHNGRSVHDTVEKFVLKEHEWQNVAPLTTGRYSHGAAYRKEIIYVCGGVSEYRSNEALNTCEMFNMTSENQNPVWENIVSMHVARRAFSLMALPDGQIYAFYGKNKTFMTREIDVFDPDIKKWHLEGATVIGRAYSQAVNVPQSYQHYEEGY